MKILNENKAPSNAFLIISFVFLFVNLFLAGYSVSLWDDDESAYAGFALRMIETGDWVNPQYTWSDVHRKTPFHFWTIAVSYLIFGVNEFAVRFPSALAVLLTALSLFLFAKPVFGEVKSKWATVIFSSSLLCVSMGKMSLTDAWLMLFETVAVLSIYNFINQPNWRWNLLLWLSVSIGILVKGPPIIIVSGGVWLGLFAFHPKRLNLIKTHPWFFGILSLIPFLIWAYCSYLSDGGKLLKFLYDWYVVKRIGGTVFGQSGPPGYHLVVAIISFLPWIGFFLRSFSKLNIKNENFIFLAFWLLFAWIFFEIMPSKLPSYAMGAHPAFALLLAQVILGSLEKNETSWSWILTSLFWLVLPVSLLMFSIFFDPDQLFIALIVSVPLMLLSIALLFVKMDLKIFFSFLYGSLTLLLIWQFVGTALENSSAKSNKRIVEKMIELSEEKKYHTKEIQAALVGFSPRQLKMSFPFYVERSFKKMYEWRPEEAISALNSKVPTIILIGEEALEPLSKAMKDGILKAKYYSKDIEWLSLNDQLKNHPFAIMHNLEK
jgi:4-amino-4-deoxy-L-arabinose transferase-like glycosyltransferase